MTVVVIIASALDGDTRGDGQTDLPVTYHESFALRRNVNYFIVPMVGNVARRYTGYWSRSSNQKMASCMHHFRISILFLLPSVAWRFGLNSNRPCRFNSNELFEPTIFSTRWHSLAPNAVIDMPTATFMQVHIASQIWFNRK